VPDARRLGQRRPAELLDDELRGTLARLLC
jgi:hypothetical protein